MAYQTGGGGYGGVYRPLPNIAQQTVRPPLVGAVGDPPVPFPPLGQWAPGSMDPPATTIRTRQLRPFLPVGDPPALFSLAGAPTQAPAWPSVAAGQRLPITPAVIVLPPGIAFPTPPAWYALHWPAYLRDWPIPLLTQRLASLPVGDPSVPFPQLGGWPVGIMDAPSVRIQVATRPVQVPVGDSPALFSIVQSPWIAAGPSVVFFAQRLPLVAVPLILSVPYPTPAQWYGMHVGAYLRDVSPAFLQRSALMPLGGDPVASAVAQIPWNAPPWPFVPVAQRLPITQPVLIISGIAYPTPAQWMALHAAAFVRDWSVPLLTQRSALLPVGAPASAFPFLGGWQPGSMNGPDMSVQQIAFRLHLRRIGNAPVPFPPIGGWRPGSMSPADMNAQIAGLIRFLAPIQNPLVVVIQGPLQTSAWAVSFAGGDTPSVGFAGGATPDAGAAGGTDSDLKGDA